MATGSEKAAKVICKAKVQGTTEPQKEMPRAGEPDVPKYGGNACCICGTAARSSPRMGKPFTWRRGIV
jgi:hypothetical protein